MRTREPVVELPKPNPEIVRHLLFGTLTGVQNTIKDLHSKRYAEPNDWSRPITTGRENEVMAILTRRVQPAPEAETGA